jgi:Dolichyl-phosphate-mannose-protein mannosyltransferase
MQSFWPKRGKELNQSLRRMKPAASSMPDSQSGKWSGVAFGLIFAAVFLLHLPLLRLPYFWDEAGYYIPAARDLLHTGSIVPQSTPSSGHPPLVMAYLAAWWKLIGFTPLVTRSAMVLLSAFALLGVFRLALRVSNPQIAIASTLCTGLYPVFFAQSTMAHVDLAAAGLTLWGLDSYLGKRMRTAAVWFSLAVLAKETAILTPLALLGWAVLCPFVYRRFRAPICDAEPVGRSPLLAPVFVLALWYGYHYWRTGYVFGNPEFFRYNVQATTHPLRILLALAMRLWQVIGYMHLWVLTLLMGWALARPPLRDDAGERPRIALPVQFVFGAVILTYDVAMAVVGGAVLARYMLTAVPLLVILAVSTLWRRIRGWPWLIASVCLAFVAALFLNPPYGFSPEDNLAYRDYIRLHLEAEQFLQGHLPTARVLTAWPASDELSQPYLGYVTRPIQVVRIEDFSFEEITASAESRSKLDAVLIFSTKYDPPHALLAGWVPWQKMKTRFFGYHRDLPPPMAAQLLGGTIVFQKERQGQWIAVIQLERDEDAALRKPEWSGCHKMAGVRFHHEPHGAPWGQAQRVSRCQC